MLATAGKAKLCAQIYAKVSARKARALWRAIPVWMRSHLMGSGGGEHA